MTNKIKSTKMTAVEVNSPAQEPQDKPILNSSLCYRIVYYMDEKKYSYGLVPSDIFHLWKRVRMRV